ncbi:class I adenylate-forming enzyme family protein [Phenylobacterium montanum]|uniref:AMP-binding protein n=1 Tax=Phenylobacterium montanum TaxID=2823693 RepID=A0A975G036_9CAUL|nr:AMP-binding protein [Caulobacter sp. S6]QUD88324.1 AMP-binding protein [Caulobacter sp. S6]
MYRVLLEKSYFPAVSDGPVEAISIGELLRRRAQAMGDAPALKALGYDGQIGRTWTFGQLLADAERLGRALASRHAPGARIAVYANNVPEWVLLEFGAALAGMVLVTVNPAFQKRELKYVLEQSRAEAIYYVEAFRGNPMRAIADEACDEVPAVGHRILMTDHAALFAGHEAGVLPQVSPHDVAQIQYTSGTTGFPKGALLHHHGLVRNAAALAARMDLKPGDIAVHNMPLFHTSGCGILVLGCVGVGATMLLAPAFDPGMIVEVIERERPRFVLGVPTMLVALTDEAERSGRDVSSVERMMSGGSMVAPDLARRAQAVFGAVVQIVYGQTEASPGITLGWHDDTLEDLTETIGQPLPDMEVAILHPRTGEVLPVGEQGEICTRGYHVMTGYNNNPEATAQAIDRDGWLHTGDLGRMDARGYLSVTGRVKEMIIRGGENLFPAEIENALLEHADIGEVAAVGVPDPVYGEQVACFMRASGERRPEARELKAFIRERLSPQKTPHYWIWVEAWPLTGSGKIQKFVLAEQFGRGEHETFQA